MSFQGPPGKARLPGAYTFVIRASWLPGFPWNFWGPPGLARLPHVVFHVFVVGFELEFESATH